MNWPDIGGMVVTIAVVGVALYVAYKVVRAIDRVIDVAIEVLRELRDDEKGDA